VRREKAACPPFSLAFIHVALVTRLVNQVNWTPGVRRLLCAGGIPVAVRFGPFAGLAGVVERPVPGRSRVRVLLDLLRRQTPTDCGPADLDRLAGAPGK
jgi:hypothetical protein